MADGRFGTAAWAARRCFTAPALAEAVGASVRTVMRDLAYLREAGMPLEGEAGRGGGLRMLGDRGVTAVHLSFDEIASGRDDATRIRRLRGRLPDRRRAVRFCAVTARHVRRCGKALWRSFYRWIPCGAWWSCTTCTRPPGYSRLELLPLRTRSITMRDVLAIALTESVHQHQTMTRTLPDSESSDARGSTFDGSACVVVGLVDQLFVHEHRAPPWPTTKGRHFTEARLRIVPRSRRPLRTPSTSTRSSTSRK